MTIDLDALSQSAPAPQTPCACGCGQFLPPGSVRQYKRGHKERPPAIRREPIADPGEPLGEPWSLEQARDSVPDDPDSPSLSLDERGNAEAPPIRITKRVRDDIEGKLGMMYGFITLGIQMRDPICGSALEQNADSIVAKMVPIICKSPELVKWFTKGGGYMLWMELVMCFMPVLKVVAQHHLFHTIGEPRANPTQGDPLQPDFSQYKAA